MIVVVGDYFGKCDLLAVIRGNACGWHHADMRTAPTHTLVARLLNIAAGEATETVRLRVSCFAHLDQRCVGSARAIAVPKQ